MKVKQKGVVRGVGTGVVPDRVTDEMARSEMSDGHERGSQSCRELVDEEEQLTANSSHSSRSSSSLWTKLKFAELTPR